MSPLLGIALVLGALGLLMGAVKGAQGAWGLHPEWSRKLVHMGMGFLTLAFPWIFRSPGPVWALCAVAVGALAAVRWWPRAKAVGGGVLDGVARASFGEFYFPIAVAILFQLTGRDPLRYVIPVLVLSLADAVAALVGTRYGQSPYSTKEGTKSWEGSLAFFVVSFFAVHVPLLLCTDTGRAQTLLIALTLALVVMLFEAVAWGGLDNLFIPLGTHFLLGTYLRLDVLDLAARFGVTLVLVAFVFAWRRRTTLNDAALMGAALAGYAFYALGGLEWVLPPLALFLLYTRVGSDAAPARSHSIYAVLGTAGPAVLWLILHRLEVPGQHYAAFAACYGAHLAIAALARWACDRPDRSIPALAARAVGLGVAGLGAVLVLRGLLMGHGARGLFLGGAALLAGTAAGTTLFALWQPGLRDCPDDGPRWLRQALCGVAASAVAYLCTTPWL